MFLNRLPIDGSSRLTVGLSACLAGQRVYHDGSNQRETPGLDWLTEEFRVVTVCPEVASGFGTPRPPIALADGDGAAVLAGLARVTRRDGKNVTEQMVRGAARSLRSAERSGVAGFVLRDLSPSCGVTRTSLRGRKQQATPGEGVFAALARRARVPVVPEGALVSPLKRQEFADRVRIVDFIKRHAGDFSVLKDLEHLWHELKLFVLASDPRAYARIREAFNHFRLQRLTFAETRDRVLNLLIDALCRPVSDSRRANALSHAWGYLARRGAAEHRPDMARLLHRAPNQRSCAVQATERIDALSDSLGVPNLLRLPVRPAADVAEALPSTG